MAHRAKVGRFFFLGCGLARRRVRERGNSMTQGWRKFKKASELRKLVGKTIERVDLSSGQLGIRFDDGSTCQVRIEEEMLVVSVPEVDPHGPTSRQREYLRFIQKYMDQYRIAPSESRIAGHFMVSPPSAHQMIVALEKRGFITRVPGQARSIRFDDPEVRW